MIKEEADFTLGKDFRKVKVDLDKLLEDPDILNSTAPSSSNNESDEEEENQGEGSGAGNNNNQNTTKQDLTFTIDDVLQHGNEDHYFLMISGLTHQGIPIYSLDIKGNHPLLAHGNKITIKGVDFGPNKAEIDPRAHDIVIKNYFDDIQRASSISGNGGTGGNGGRGSGNDPLKVSQQSAIDEI